MLIRYMLITLMLLAIASTIRIIVGPTVWDRLLGLNLFASKISMLIVLYAWATGKSYFLDIAIVYVLLGFIGSIFISRFIQGKGTV